MDNQKALFSCKFFRLDNKQICFFRMDNKILSLNDIDFSEWITKILSSGRFFRIDN